MAENAFEWLTGQSKATLTLSQQRYKNRVMKLKEKYPEDVEVVAGPENNEGYLYVRIPVAWIRIMPPHKSTRVWTEEEKEVLRERLRLMREKRKANLEKGLNIDKEQEVIEELEETLGEDET